MFAWSFLVESSPKKKGKHFMTFLLHRNGEEQLKAKVREPWIDKGKWNADEDAEESRARESGTDSWVQRAMLAVLPGSWHCCGQQPRSCHQSSTKLPP